MIGGAVEGSCVVAVVLVVSGEVVVTFAVVMITVVGVVM